MSRATRWGLAAAVVLGGLAAAGAWVARGPRRVVPADGVVATVELRIEALGGRIRTRELDVWGLRVAQATWLRAEALSPSDVAGFLLVLRADEREPEAAIDVYLPAFEQFYVVRGRAQLGSFLGGGLRFADLRPLLEPEALDHGPVELGDQRTVTVTRWTTEYGLRFPATARVTTPQGVTTFTVLAIRPASLTAEDFGLRAE